MSFIGIYTNCVTDANYIQPLFAVLLVLANAVHCLRMPYNLMILAGGHYKQTQNNYIVAAIMNITVYIGWVLSMPTSQKKCNYPERMNDVEYIESSKAKKNQSDQN